MPSHGGPGAVLALSSLQELSSERKQSCLTAMNNAPCNCSTEVVEVGGMVFKIELDLLQTLILRNQDFENTL